MRDDKQLQRYQPAEVKFHVQENDPLHVNLPSKTPELHHQNMADRLSGLLSDHLTDDERLVLLERFGGFVAAQNEKGEALGGVSWFDHARVQAALEACGEQVLMVRADLSGIQSFIYDIEDKGALRALRARSFYLELLAQHVILEILQREKLSRVHVTYVGGGGFQLLLPPEASTTLHTLQDELDDWLWTTHEGQLGLILEWVETSKSALQNPHSLSEVSRELSRKISVAKSQRRKDDLLEVFSGAFEEKQDETLKKALLAVGQALPKARFVEVLREPPKEKGAHFHIHGSWYVPKADLPKGKVYFALNSFQHLNAIPMLTGNFSTRVEHIPEDLRPSEQDPDEANRDPQSMSTFEQLAKVAVGQERIAVYRCDADNMGKIFSGLIPQHTLERHATLSRLMALFFQGYTNSIATKTGPLVPGAPYREAKHGRYLNFVYAGGDDVFVVGAWHDVLAFAVDLRRAYAAFTGQNPKLGLSGGSFLSKPKYPLRRMAARSEEAEKLAKSIQGKDGFVPFLQGENAAEATRWDAFMDLKNQLGMEYTLDLLEDFVALRKDSTEDALELEVSRGLVWKLNGFVNTFQRDQVWSIPQLHYAVARHDVKNQAFTGKWNHLRTRLLQEKNWKHLGSVLSYLHLARPQMSERMD